MRGHELHRFYHGQGHSWAQSRVVIEPTFSKLFNLLLIIFIISNVVCYK